jgi:aldehyde dehydrogenase (NAD+)
MTATERGRVLVTIGEMVLGHEEELAQIEARDTGKPMTTARNDIKVPGRCFEFYGSAADKAHGQTIPFLPGHQVSLLRQAHAVRPRAA